LHLKSIRYSCKYVNLLRDEQHSAAYAAVNPSCLVPSLQILTKAGSCTTITQSIAALEYLEEQYPGCTPLLPPALDVAGRAHVRNLVGIIASDTQPVTNLRILSRVGLLGGAKEQWARELMAEGLAAYEQLSASSAGRFSYGDVVTMADACLVPAVWGAIRYGVDLGAYPTVKAIYEEMSKLEAVSKADWRVQGDTPEELRG